MRKLLFFLLTFLLCVNLCACGRAEESTVAEKPQTTSDTAAESLAALSRGGNTAIVLKDGASSGSGVRIDGDTVYITGEGSYTLSGSLTNGQILVDVPDGSVALTLDNVSVACENTAALYVVSAKNVYLTTAENSVNTLSTEGDFIQTDDNNVDAAIFSKASLFLSGSGELEVSCANGHGIVSKDALEIHSGTYTIRAASKGICGKDRVDISGGVIQVEAGTDGIFSENTKDAEKGTVTIQGGTLHLICGRDGIDASGNILVEDGSFEISTSGSDSSQSYKGIKSNGSITINGGSFTIDAADDAIHANDSVCISGGELTLSSGDDGIHADAALTVTSGSIEVTQSYEGFEALTIDISGGEIRIVSSDDGLNAAGGNDSSGHSGMFGKDPFAGTEGASITISGGSLYVNAEGDGIDSNGSLLVSGGITYVCGPTNSADGALDYVSSGSVTGGTIVAVGAAGMAQNFDSSSTQGVVMYNLSATQAAGSKICLTDSEGKDIISFTPEKSYQSVIISTPDIRSGSTYLLTAGNENAEIEMTGTVYANGGMGGVFGGKGGHGQMSGDDWRNLPSDMPGDSMADPPGDMPGGGMGTPPSGGQGGDWGGFGGHP